MRNHGFCGDWIAGNDTVVEQTDEPVPPADPVIPAWMPEQFYRGYIGYLQQYTHNVNLVRWLLDAGDDVTVKYVDLDPRDGLSGVVVMDVAGGRTVLESGTVAYHGWDEQTQIYFERGWVRTAAPPLLLKNVPATVEVYRSDKGKGSSQVEIFPDEGWTWSYKQEMRHFIDSVLHDTAFESSAQDTLVDVRTFEQIYAQFVDAQAR